MLTSAIGFTVVLPVLAVTITAIAWLFQGIQITDMPVRLGPFNIAIMTIAPGVCSGLILSEGHGPALTILIIVLNTFVVAAVYFASIVIADEITKKLF